MNNSDHVLYNGVGTTKYAPKEKKTEGKNGQGTFAGWISKEWAVAWVVSPHRADKQTGATVNRPMGSYAEELLAAAIPWGRRPKPPSKKPRAKRFKGLYQQ